jgi:hypothetical protein
VGWPGGFAECDPRGLAHPHLVLNHLGCYLDRNIAARAAEPGRDAVQAAFLLRVRLLIGGSAERLYQLQTAAPLRD